MTQKIRFEDKMTLGKTSDMVTIKSANLLYDEIASNQIKQFVKLRDNTLPKSVVTYKDLIKYMKIEKDYGHSNFEVDQIEQNDFVKKMKIIIESIEHIYIMSEVSNLK